MGETHQALLEQEEQKGKPGWRTPTLARHPHTVHDNRDGGNLVHFHVCAPFRQEWRKRGFDAVSLYVIAVVYGKRGTSDEFEEED